MRFKEDFSNAIYLQKQAQYISKRWFSMLMQISLFSTNITKSYNLIN